LIGRAEMAVSLADVKRWRERAEEIRTLAKTFSHSASKRTLQEVAESYDRRANHAEAILSLAPDQG
jgi:hypothetical protein